MNINWNYHVMPGFIVREDKERLEVKNPKTDNWEDETKNLELWRMIAHDGVHVSEEEALKTYEFFKKDWKDETKG